MDGMDGMDGMDIVGRVGTGFGKPGFGSAGIVAPADRICYDSGIIFKRRYDKCSVNNRSILT